MIKAVLLVIFFLLTPLALALSLSLLSHSYQKNSVLSQGQNAKIAFAALPAASGSLKTTINAQDARLASVRVFFQRYNPALIPYAINIVESADKYGLDYRLLPAIGMQESNLCKKFPKNSYNCWGFGIYGTKVTRFDNYKDAIETVSKTLAKNYKAIGLETPEQIMTKYTPGSNGSWADGVNHFMDQLATNL